MDYYFQGAWRMDWGFGNPNKTATFIACLMIAGWAGTLVWRWAFWFVLPIFTALGLCLIQTYSRGGMLALLAGSAVLLIWTPRPWPRARWIGVLASLWVMGSFVLYARAESRYGQGLFGEDQSITARMIIWQYFPAMFSAAPWGWGWGKAGDAYTQWFQPYGQSTPYLNLINSHFTWMTEGGWMFSILYIWAWISALVLCWPRKEAQVTALPFAVVVAVGVGGCFSHVEESGWLWIIPSVCLTAVLIQRLRARQWPSRWGFGLGALASTVAVAALIVIGQLNAGLPIKATGEAVVVGSGARKAVIYIDRVVMGKLYGHALRKYLDENHDLLASHAYIVTESPSYVAPAGADQVVVGGRMLRESSVALAGSRSGQIVLINPDCFPEETKGEFGVKTVFVYFGEYSQSPARSSWAAGTSVKAIFIEGAGDFVPSWPQVVWKSSGI